MYMTLDVKPAWHLRITARRQQDTLRAGNEEPAFTVTIERPPGARGDYPPRLQLSVPDLGDTVLSTLVHDDAVDASLYYFLRTTTNVDEAMSTAMIIEPGRLVPRNGDWFIAPLAQHNERYTWCFMDTVRGPNVTAVKRYTDKLPLAWGGLLLSTGRLFRPRLDCMAVGGELFSLHFENAAVSQYTPCSDILVPCDGDSFDNVVYAVVVPDEDGAEAPVHIVMDNLVHVLSTQA